MANEITVRSGLRVKMAGKTYDSRPDQFNASAANPRGPSPGILLSTTAGVDVDFSALDLPTYCRITNNDPNNFIEYGIWDGSDFHPLGEVLARQSYTIRLSRNLTTLRIKADTADCDCLVEAFEEAAVPTTTTTTEEP